MSGTADCCQPVIDLRRRPRYMHWPPRSTDAVRPLGQRFTIMMHGNTTGIIVRHLSSVPVKHIAACGPPWRSDETLKTTRTNVFKLTDGAGVHISCAVLALWSDHQLTTIHSPTPSSLISQTPSCLPIRSDARNGLPNRHPGLHLLRRSGMRHLLRCNSSGNQCRAPALPAQRVLQTVYHVMDLHAAIHMPRMPGAYSRLEH
jgi:hypothetical protein